MYKYIDTIYKSNIETNGPTLMQDWNKWVKFNEKGFKI